MDNTPAVTYRTTVPSVISPTASFPTNSPVPHYSSLIPPSRHFCRHLPEEETALDPSTERPEGPRLPPLSPREVPGSGHLRERHLRV